MIAVSATCIGTLAMLLLVDNPNSSLVGAYAAECVAIALAAAALSPFAGAVAIAAADFVLFLGAVAFAVAAFCSNPHFVLSSSFLERSSTFKLS